MPQGPPNPGFMQEKVQKGDFLKKPSRELNFFCCFRFLRISRRPGTLNWKRLVLLLSKILYKQCVVKLYNGRKQDGLGLCLYMAQRKDSRFERNPTFSHG